MLHRITKTHRSFLVGAVVALGLAKVYKQKGQKIDVRVLHFIFCGSKCKTCLFLSLNIPKDPIIAQPSMNPTQLASIMAKHTEN